MPWGACENVPSVSSKYGNQDQLPIPDGRGGMMMVSLQEMADSDIHDALYGPMLWWEEKGAFGARVQDICPEVGEQYTCGDYVHHWTKHHNNTSAGAMTRPNGVLTGPPMWEFRRNSLVVLNRQQFLLVLCMKSPQHPWLNMTPKQTFGALCNNTPEQGETQEDLEAEFKACFGRFLGGCAGSYASPCAW